MKKVRGARAKFDRQMAPISDEFMHSLSRAFAAAADAAFEAAAGLRKILV